MFAESLALGKELLCRVPEFAESQALGKASFAECWVWRSAKWLFAECPSFATRQTSMHSAKIQFPVVRPAHSKPSLLGPNNCTVSYKKTALFRECNLYHSLQALSYFPISFFWYSAISDFHQQYKTTRA